jgi:ATP-dependent RNA helicase RhlE
MFLRDIEKLIAKRIPVEDNHPFPLMNHNPEPAASQQQNHHRHPKAKVKQAHAGSGSKRNSWHGNRQRASQR